MRRRGRSPNLPMVAALLLLGACGGRSDLSADASAPIDAGRAIDGGPGEDAAVSEDAGVDDAGTVGDAGSEDAGPDLGADNGEPCAAPEDCRSAAEASEDVPACLMTGTWPNGGGWTNGYCASACAKPPPIDDGVALEQRDCPSGSLCTPLSGDPAGTFDFGICLRGCDTDEDCRAEEGYYCRRDWRFSVTTPNGVCMPMHCVSRGCPGSAVCAC